MKRVTAIIVVTFCTLASPGAGDETESPEQDHADAKRLRLLLPKMLKSSDTTIMHEALLILRDDAIRSRTPSDELLTQVAATLRRLLAQPQREEAGSRRLACEVVWRARWKKGIPVLLEALDDPHEETEFVSAGAEQAAHLEWHAVWKTADNALRNLTEASPIDAPTQRAPIPGQRERVRKAWREWHQENAEPPAGGDAKDRAPQP